MRYVFILNELLRVWRIFAFRQKMSWTEAVRRTNVLESWIYRKFIFEIFFELLSPNICNLQTCTAFSSKPFITYLSRQTIICCECGFVLCRSWFYSWRVWLQSWIYLHWRPYELYMWLGGTHQLFTHSSNLHVPLTISCGNSTFTHRVYYWVSNDSQKKQRLFP